MPRTIGTLNSRNGLLDVQLDLRSVSTILVCSFATRGSFTLVFILMIA